MWRPTSSKLTANAIPFGVRTIIQYCRVQGHEVASISCWKENISYFNHHLKRLPLHVETMIIGVKY